MYSEYYEREFSQRECWQALQLYLEWCKEHHLEPETEVIEEGVTDTGMLDHVLYHAEIQLQDIQKGMTNALSDYFLSPSKETERVLRTTWNDMKNAPIFLDFSEGREER